MSSYYFGTKSSAFRDKLKATVLSAHMWTTAIPFIRSICSYIVHVVKMLHVFNGILR